MKVRISQGEGNMQSTWGFAMGSSEAYFVFPKWCVFRRVNGPITDVAIQIFKY